MLMKISVLVSGGGTNLQALIDAQTSGVLHSGRIVQVISSSRGAYALKRAEAAGIRADCADIKDYADRAAFESALSALLDEVKPDVIVLAGFMHILSAEFVSRRKGRIINVHPSLIPSFCGEGFYGLKVHEAALASGVKVTGATVHLVTDVTDGGPILMQKAVDILPDDTPKTLQRRVMEQAEWQLLPRAAEELCAKLLSEKGFRLAEKSYPGRGIIIGAAPDGRAALAYFIMGRSAGSRARVFEKDGGEVLIRLLDPSKVNDPSLILYKPVRVSGNNVIVTNGDQTDTIYDAVSAGGTFEEALRTREYEPDPPHFTPRVSGMITLPQSGAPGDAGGSFSYRLSILKSLGCGAENRPCARFFFEYGSENGVGHLIHTYEDDGAVLPSFSGEPRRVSIPNDIDEFTENLWDALNEDNRVSMYVRYISRDGKTFDDRLINKNAF